MMGAMGAYCLETPRDARMPTRSVLSVLVADDSPVLRRLLADAITEVDGVEVVAQASDGQAALDGVAAHQPCVVVLDLQMPVMGGLPALAHLRQLGRDPRVIILTNHAGDAYRTACLDAGADHFFDKSRDMDDVLDVLREWAQAQPQIEA